MISICGKKYGVDISHLNLANKGLTRIPEEIKYLTNLRRLNLSNNRLFNQSAFS
jgi:Leucine-rich repeat (LRR) protein